MDNVADLPWTALESLVREVSGVGLVQLTLLRALHARMQAELEAKSGRSSRSGSRSSSRAGSGSGVQPCVSRQEAVPLQASGLDQQRRRVEALGSVV